MSKINKHYIQNKDLYDKSLFYGVIENSVGTVKYYLDTGAPINLIFTTKNNNFNGHTLLTLAVSEGRLAIVRELLKRGADVNLRNGQGNIALDYIPKKYAGKINTLLQERKAFKEFLYGEVTV
jgi:ankyrin repeat protein